MAKKKKSSVKGIKSELVGLLKRSFEGAKGKVLTLRKVSKNEGFALKNLKHYSSREDYKKFMKMLKQKKTKLKIKQQGYSFLISGKDLMPVPVSGDKWIKEFAEKVELKFYENKITEFSERAWNIIPEYIAPKVLGQKNLKLLLTVLLFSSPVNLVVIGGKGTASIIRSARSFRRISVSTAKKKTKKRYDLYFMAAQADLGKFFDMAEKSQKSVEIKRSDINFLRMYIREARKLNVFVPNKFESKFKNRAERELAIGSARIDLRTEVNENDIKRISTFSL